MGTLNQKLLIMPQMSESFDDPSGRVREIATFLMILEAIAFGLFTSKCLVSDTYFLSICRTLLLS